MTNLVIDSMQMVFSSKVSRRFGLMLAGAGALLWQIGQPALAGDPFRTDEPRDISDISEQVFYAMFRDGDYMAVQEYLANTDASLESDPMFHAMDAALSYLEEDWDGLLDGAIATQDTAEALYGSDELRANLYEAVGIFLEGAHILQTEGIAGGTPRALGMLQQVFSKMDTAAALDPTDPELSLIKGFMDLLLAVNLPFANPEQAIEQLATYGQPNYVAHRGIAIGYRDLDRNEEALEAVEAAIAAAPNNPDLFYLKAQILVRLGGDGDNTEEMDYLRLGIDFFDQALASGDQLLPEMVRQIDKEKGRACRRLDENPCDE